MRALLASPIALLTMLTLAGCATARTADGWEVTGKFGPIRFLYGEAWRPELDAMNADNKEQHVLFVLRPGELGLEHPTHVILRPDGQPALWLFDLTM